MARVPVQSSVVSLIQVRKIKGRHEGWVGWMDGGRRGVKGNRLARELKYLPPVSQTTLSMPTGDFMLSVCADTLKEQKKELGPVRNRRFPPGDDCNCFKLTGPRRDRNLESGRRKPGRKQCEFSRRGDGSDEKDGSEEDVSQPRPASLNHITPPYSRSDVCHLTLVAWQLVSSY